MQRTVERASSGESIEKKHEAFHGASFKPLSAQCGTRPRIVDGRQLRDSKSMDKQGFAQAASAQASPRTVTSGVVGLGLSQSMNNHPMAGMLNDDHQKNSVKGR